MLKENFAYFVLIIDLIIFVAWPFLVFFHFIWPGLIMLIGFSLLSAIIYEIYHGLELAEHKLIHHKPY